MTNNNFTNEACVELMEKHFGNEVVVNWCGMDVTVKRVLPYSTVKYIIDKVVKGCFADNGEYMPESKEVSMRAFIVGAYTDITLPDDAGIAYDFLYRTDIVSVVYNNADISQLNYINASINKKVDYIATTNAKAIDAAVAKLTAALGSMSGSMEELFSGVTSDDVANMARAFGTGKIDEEKLMNAYISNMAKTGDVNG